MRPAASPAANLQVQLEPGVRPQPLAIFQRHPDHAHRQQGNARKECIAPALVQGLIHPGPGKRQQSTAYTPEHRVRRGSTGCICRERINKICTNGREDGDHAEADEESADDGHEPEDAVLSRPPVQEQTKRDHGTAGDHGRQPVLGLHLAAACHFLDDSVRNCAKKEEPGELAAAEAEVDEADVGDDAVSVAEDLGHRSEEQVQDAVGDCSEEGEAEDDGRKKEHLDGADDTSGQDLAAGLVGVGSGSGIGSLA